MIRIQVDSSGAIAKMGSVESGLKNSLFRAISISTSLARETTIDNIKHGMKKGLGWPQFSKSTIAYKTKKGRTLEGLVNTGQMFGRMHEKVNKTKLEGTVMPGVNYFKYQELKTKKIPARPMMQPVPKQINKNVNKIFKSEIAKAF